MGPSTLDQWARRPEARALFFIGIAALAAWPWLSTAGAFNEFRDAQVLWLYEDSARRSVLQFGQWPLWNPDFCGGLPALGTPQARFAAPTFLLTLLLGTSRAEPVLLFAMVSLALFGAHRFAREQGATQLGATVGAPVFGLMGVFACAPFLGWFGFLGFALLPWLLVGLHWAAKGDVKGVWMVSASTAFIVGFGGTYVAPISLVACVIELLLLWWKRRRISLWSLGIAAALAVGSSAFRLWPVWEELQRGRRVIAGLSSVDFVALGAQLFGTWPAFTHEAWYFVSVPAALVAGFALLRRRGRWLLGPFAIWMWLAAGNAVSPSLYGLLRELPVFSLLRNSERFLVGAALCLSVSVALAITHVSARRRHRRAGTQRFWPLTLALVGVALALSWQLQNFALAASKRTLGPPPETMERPFHQARGNRWAAASFGPASRGSLACWEAYGVPQSPLLRADAEHEAWLSDASAGTIEETRWTPQRLTYRAQLDRPSQLIVNQNYHRGWKSNVGTVVNHEGLLAVELPPGANEVSLHFLPRSAWGGLLTSMLALAAQLMLRRLGTKHLRMLAAVAPLGVLGLLALTNPEPASATDGDRGPDGEPLVVDALPSDVQPAHVTFEGGVTLEGSSVEYRASPGQVRIELDWSRVKGLNRHLGIFVHIEPGTLKRITADHLQVSDAHFLEEIPLGQVGRDIMVVDVPLSRRGQTWNVWVGLWEMRGDGHRMAITDAAGQSISDGRVLAGSIVVPAL